MSQQGASWYTRMMPMIRIAVCLLLLAQVVACVVGAGPSLGGKVDFRAFYAAGAIVRSGHGAQLYDYDYEAKVQHAVVGPRVGALPFLYPAVAALPFVPLSLLSYKTAFVIFATINCGLLLIAAFLLRPWLPSFRMGHWLVLPVCFGASFGVSVAMMQGQVSFLLLVIYCGVWLALEGDRKVVAGILLSLGLIKFQVALPIVLLFIVWRQWRVVWGFILGGGAMVGISIAVAGKAGSLLYVRSLAGMTQQTAFHVAAAKARYGMSPEGMPNLHGLTYGIAHGARWALILNIALSCLVLIYAARQTASLLVALPAALLVSYHMQPHDLTLLLLPLSVLIDALLRQDYGVAGTKWARFWRPTIVLPCSLLLLVLPLAAILMAHGMGYVVAAAVLGVLVSAESLREPRSLAARSVDENGIRCFGSTSFVSAEGAGYIQ